MCNKTFRCVSVLLISAVCAATVQGAPVAETDIPAAATNWLMQAPAFRTDSVRSGSGYQVGRIEPVASDEPRNIIAYGVHLVPAGWLLMPADDRLLPVLAYSETGELELHATGPGLPLAAWVQTVVGTRLAVMNTAAQALEDRADLTDTDLTVLDLAMQGRAAWQALKTSPRATRDWEVNVGPYLSCFFGQSYDLSDSAPGKHYTYNYYTPDIGTTRTLTGCVATAMAQTMKFYAWPLAGVGTHSYTWAGPPSQTLSANFAAHTYDWASILDVYRYPNDGSPPVSTEAQRQQVGRLLYDCGVAAEMNFGTGVSTASPDTAAAGMREHFRYASATYLDHTDLPAADILTRVRSELLAGMPTLIELLGNGGHVAVGDGLRKDAASPTYYYHLNLGWQGWNSGWYDITSFFITSGGEGPGSDYSGTYSWSGVHGAVVSIVPGLLLNDLGGAGGHDYNVSWQHSAQLHAQAYELQEATRLPATNGKVLPGENATSIWTVAGRWESRNVGGVATSIWWGLPSDTILDQTESLQLNHIIRVPAGSGSIEYDVATPNFYGLRRTTELSVDGGLTWHAVLTHNGPVVTGPVTVENSLTWQHEAINLSDFPQYGGQNALLRFTVSVFSSSLVNSYNNGSVALCGVYLDKVTISNAETYGWSTLAADLTTDTYAFSNKPLARYYYRVRARKLDSWFAWSNILEYETVILPVYTLTLGTGAGGISSPEPDSYHHDQGTVVQLTATPDDHYDFVSWTVNGTTTVTANPYTFALIGDTSVMANFAPQHYQLTVVSDFGIPDPPVGANNATYGVPLIASCNNSPVAGGAGIQYAVTGWTLVHDRGNCEVGQGAITSGLLLTAPATLTWHWQQQLSLTATATGHGQVRVVDGQQREVSNPGWFPAGQRLTLRAIPDSGYQFDAWHGNLPEAADPSNPNITCDLNEPLALTADFIAVTDADADGLPDAWELRYWPQVNAEGAGLDDDPDGDRLKNQEEFQRGTSPTVPTLHLWPGWNLIAVPRTPAPGTTVSVQLAPVSPLWVLRWNGTQLMPMADDAADAADRVLQPGQGYWVYSWGELYVDVPGTALGSGALSLPRGWSLVGSIHGGSLANLPIGSAWIWQAAGAFYRKPQGNVVEPLRGCWLFCPDPANFTMP